MNKIKRMLTAWIALIIMFSLGAILLSGGDAAIKTIRSTRDNNVTLNWSPKSSMKYETIEYDWSDEEPLLQELLIEPIMDFERI